MSTLPPPLGYQQTLPYLRQHMTMDHVSVGVAGELFIAASLEAAGYLVSTIHVRGDLKVITPDGEILYVEIKTARLSTDKKYRFTLYKKGHTDHRHADIVILVCILKSGDVVPFVVPAAAVRDQKQAVITSYPHTYAGRFAQYRQRPKSLTLS
jgi:hypothetical protein